MPRFPKAIVFTGYVVTGLGLIGVAVSLMISKSDYDPVAFGLAAVSILVSIVGISYILKS